MDGSGLVTEVLVNHTPYETRVAILEGGVLQDFFVERERKRGIVGNIYKGKVQRVLPGMDAAFIDIGLERAGFLHVKNVVRRGDKPPERISDVLREGQSLLVQVLKDPIGSKGARLTMEISIPSRFLVFLPTADEIGVSIKIASEEQRQTLREAVAALPDELLLVETDAPYLPPRRWRGRPNASYLLGDTVRFLAEQRGLSEEDLCLRLQATTEAVYGSW